ncbi:hypothetical protein Hanom_Chr04g00291811 [Helianthus anomalus]
MSFGSTCFDPYKKVAYIDPVSQFAAVFIQNILYRFKDYEDMLEDTWHIDFPRRPDVSDGLYSGINNPLQMWDNYPYMSNQQKKEDNIGLADAITKSILSTGNYKPLILLIRVTPCYIFAHFSLDLRLIGRIDLQRKLFCSMQLIGGVALTAGLISAVEERFEIVAFYSQDFSTLLAFMLMFDRLILQNKKILKKTQQKTPLFMGDLFPFKIEGLFCVNSKIGVFKKLAARSKIA